MMEIEEEKKNYQNMEVKKRALEWQNNQQWRSMQAEQKRESNATVTIYVYQNSYAKSH